MRMALLAALLIPTAAVAERRPVVVELFTSEGCSSCPPADALLATLDRDQPIEGVEVVALEQHVDYWNGLGWADPFSSGAFSERQGAYAQAMGRSGVYTPQAVVDGAAEVVGSKSGGLKALIANAARSQTAQVQLERHGDTLRLRVGGLPAGADRESEVWLAVTERGLATDVLRGENRGEHLAHGPVVRQLEQVGALHDGQLAADVAYALPATVKRQRAQLVVFVQERKSRRILGAARIAAE